MFSWPSHDHPLSSRETVYWNDLRGETVLPSHYDPGKELEDLLVSKLVRPEVPPKIWRHDVSRGIIKSLISMNTGISLVFEADIGANSAGLVYRELRDGAGASRFELSAYWRADNETRRCTNSSSWSLSATHRLRVVADARGALSGSSCRLP
ncbi:hypothetical protein [Bradyrhizobium sp. 169]|uniref:hypothetical protein n=1 Tax=Bradyrhizobium sp. 169 TaxID=2782640 RepID=UPI0031F648B5